MNRGKRRHVESRLFKVSVGGSVVEIACWRSGGDGEGEPHAWTEAQFLSRLLIAVLTAGATTIIVDLERSGDVSTSLLAAVVEARGRARRAGAELLLRCSPAVRQLVEVCRLEEVLPRR